MVEASICWKPVCWTIVKQWASMQGSSPCGFTNGWISAIKLGVSDGDQLRPAVAHRSIVSAESAQVLVGGEHAARPPHLDGVSAPGHAVSVRRRHPLLLPDQDHAQLRSPAV